MRMAYFITMFKNKTQLTTFMKCGMQAPRSDRSLDLVRAWVRENSFACQGCIWAMGFFLLKTLLLL